MENSNPGNASSQDDNRHPKPTEDVGAKIETVTPETEKEGVSHDREAPETVEKDNPEIDQKDASAEKGGETGGDPEEKEDADSENPEKAQYQSDGDRSGIETVTP